MMAHHSHPGDRHTRRSRGRRPAAWLAAAGVSALFIVAGGSFAADSLPDDDPAAVETTVVSPAAGTVSAAAEPEPPTGGAEAAVMPMEPDESAVVADCTAAERELVRRDEAGRIDWAVFEDKIDPDSLPEGAEIEIALVPIDGALAGEGERFATPDFPDRLVLGDTVDADLVEFVGVCEEQGWLTESDDDHDAADDEFDEDDPVREDVGEDDEFEDDEFGDEFEDDDDEFRDGEFEDDEFSDDDS